MTPPRQQQPHFSSEQANGIAGGVTSTPVQRGWRWLRRAGLFCGMLLLLLSGTLTQLAQPGSFLITLTTAHAAAGASHPSGGKNTYHPVYDRGGAPFRPANQVKIAHGSHTPQVIKRSKGHLMPPFDVALDPFAATTTSSPDGQLDISVPARAITAALVAKIGGVPHLRVTQLEGASGGDDGGHVLFGSFLIRLVGPQGAPAPGGLARPITATLHLPSSFRGAGADMSQVQAAVMPSDAQGRPLKPADRSAAAQAAVAAVATPATFAPEAHTLSTIFAASSGGGTTIAWDTNAPDAHWTAQADASVDQPSGDLTYSYPLDVPPGPGGLTPKLALSYDSGNVDENHNPSATAGWLGEGWSLTGGSISWGEHNVTADCTPTQADPTPCPGTLKDCTLQTPSTCSTWEDSWQFGDPYGNGGELIPADSNQAPWWDDTANGGLTTQTIPMTWHISNETGVKVFSYENPTPNSYFPSKYYPHQPPCFRAFLPSGYMEEFGCTPDSIQWYVNSNTTNKSSYYIYRWDLDMVTDASGNQIHFQYKQAMSSSVSLGGNFPIDAVLSAITYDSPGCRNTTTMCTGAAWKPAVQIVFASDYKPTHVSATTCTAQTYSNGADYTPAQTMRCDDPPDQSGGESAPLLQSLFVLNAVQAQVTTNPGSNPTWHTLRTYNFAYENAPWTTIYDAATGERQSAAGYLDLTSIQEVGDDGGTTLPPLTMSYGGASENYLDQVYPSMKAGWCGPAWNSTACHLWSKTWNTRYLVEMDNGQGWKETFTYQEAHNNTHSVNSGLNRLDPLACNGQQANGNTCSVADDQNWSRMVLTGRTGEVLCQTAQGAACQANNPPNSAMLDSTWSYTYTLTDVSSLAKECGDCIETMYWGDQNDGDTADFYNVHFAGFQNVNVTSPDGAPQVYTYYTTKGYGIAPGITCASGNPCDVSPWTDPLNALHGRVKEEDDYNNGNHTYQVLKQTITSYAAVCPPNGVSASAHNASDPAHYYPGQNTSELDINNPIVVCRIDTTAVDTYQVDGGALLSGTHTTVAYTYTYSATDHTNPHIYWMSEDHSANDTGTMHIKTTTQYVWNDALTVTATSASGVYFDRLPAMAQTQSESGGYKACAYYGYDGGTPGATQLQSGLTHGLRTTTDQYSADCDPDNEAGRVRTTATYDANGDLRGTTDADANDGASNHLNGSDCTVNGAPMTACASYDSLYGPLVTRVTNDLRQQTNLNYTTDGGNTNSPDTTNGWGQWLTTTTDANSQTSGYGYDALGRLTATALPGDSLSSSPTTSYAYLVTCPTTGSATPCAALAPTQRLSGGTTVTSATYYDGWGRPVETVKPAFDNGAITPTVTYSVSYTMYDPSGRKNFVSDPYFTTKFWSTGAIGTPPYFAPDGNAAGTSYTYDGLGRTTLTTDPLGKATTTSYSEQQPQGANVNDTGTYAATTVVDANGHQTISLSDGLGRSRYTESFTGTSGSYALYGVSASSYDYLGDVTTVYGPAASGPAGLSTSAQAGASYDLLGRKTGMDDADLGDGWRFYYDANGNQTTVIDARGSGGGGASYVGYDPLNRPLWRNTTNSPTGAYVTYTYDQTSGGHGSGVGRLTSESFTGGTAAQPLHGGYSDSYDARGQTTNVTLTTTENATYPLSFGYNDAGQATSLTYSDGEVFSEGYNSYGWLNSALTTPSGGSPVNLLTGVSYTGTGGAAGHLSAANLGNGTYNYSASYDSDLRLSSMGLTNVALGTTLFNTSRSYDAVGNVTSVQTTLAAGTDNQAFCYDALNRLTWAGATGTPSCGSSLTPGTLSSAEYTATYSYDPLNRITGGSLGTLTFGDSAHLHGATASSASGETASYDAAGDMTCRAPTSATTCTGSSPTGAVMTYDSERRLTSWQNAPSNPTSSAAFLYDGEGHRVEQFTSGGSGNHTYYLPGNVEEVSPSGGLVKYYAAGGLALGENTAHDASGIAYLASDGLGSVSEALDQGGNVTASQLYSPYGGVRYSTGAMPTAKGFTGQYSDAATGLDYYGARYYDAALGQFTSADTATDGLNRYGYVKGNPETYTDPSGHRLNCEDGCRPPKPPTTPPPTPTGGNGTGDGGCHSDGSCGCYSDCGGGNTTGGKCGGTISCDPVSPKKKTSGCAASDSDCIACHGSGRCRAQQKAQDEVMTLAEIGLGLLALAALLGPAVASLFTQLEATLTQLGIAFVREGGHAIDWYTSANIEQFAGQISGLLTTAVALSMFIGTALLATGSQIPIPVFNIAVADAGANMWAAGLATIGIESQVMSNIYAQESLVSDGSSQTQGLPRQGPQ